MRGVCQEPGDRAQYRRLQKIELDLSLLLNCPHARPLRGTRGRIARAPFFRAQPSLPQ